MSGRITITEAADRLAKLDNCTEQERARLHRRLRNLHDKGLLPATEEKGSRSAVMFEPDVLYPARILNIVGALGFDARTLREVGDAMRRETRPGTFPADRAPSLKTDGGWWSEGGLKDALRGIGKGESWTLRIRLRQVDATGETIVRAEFVWDGEPEPDADVNRIMADYAAERGETVAAVVKIPLNRLLKPLLAGAN